MSLSSQVGLLATRVGTELKSIRANFVPNTQRGPIGGVTASTGVTGTVTLDPALANERRLTLTGDTTIALMAAGADGQRLLIEANASGGQRILTFDPAYELSSAVPVRAFTIPSGSWAYIALIYRSGTWRLTSAEPQATPDYSTPSSWVPADHGLAAWSYDPLLCNDQITPAANGYLFGSAVKLSANATITGITYSINVAGATLTANRNYIGIYNAAGTLLGQTADQSSAWASTGIKTTTLTATLPLTAGTYFIGVITTGTTRPAFHAYASYAVSTTGRSAAGQRAYITNTAYTALPATRPLPSGSPNVAWFGLS